MIITCPSCSAKYHLAESKVKASGTKVRCPRCSYQFTVFKNLESEEKVTVEPDLLEKSRASNPSSDSFLATTPTEKAHHVGLDSSADRFFNEQTKEYSSLPESIAQLQKNAKPIDSPLFEDFEKDSLIRFEPDEPDFNVPEETNVKFKKEELLDESSVENSNEDLEETLEEGSQTELAIRAHPSDSSAISRPSKKVRSSASESLDPAAKSRPPKIDPYESQAEKSKSVLRPFGQETIFAIQKQYKKFKWKKLASIMVTVGLVFWAALEVKDWLKTTQTPIHRGDRGLAKKPIDSNAPISRPPGWYQDDPRIYRDLLNQSAALPAKEQEVAENRALLAEALVLNGLLSGLTAQVIDGLSFSSSLVISFPFTPLGYYGIAAHAIWNSDRLTLRDLVERWPEAYRDEPEFMLVDAINDYLNRDKKSGLLKLAKLLTDQPEFQRANNWGLAFLLDSPDVSPEVFSKEMQERMIESYKTHRAKIQLELKEPPQWFRQIDSQLQDLDRVSRVARDSGQPSMQAPLPPEKTMPTRTSPTARAARTETPTQSLSPPARAPSAPKPTPSATTSAPSAPTPAPSASAPQRSRLPQASDNLVAQNRTSAQNRSQADQLLNQGNELFKKGDDNGALKLYRDALKLNPEFAEVYKRIGMIYMKRKESDRAIRSLKLYLQLQPNSQDKKVVEGWISSLQ
jgi:predicted Zn finger-like uncharacterized protein